MKRFSILFILMSSAVNADIVVLHNKIVLFGKIIEYKSQSIIVENDRQKEEIEFTKIKKIKLGFSGFPVCMKLIDSDLDDCELLLTYIIDEKYLLIVKKGNQYYQKIDYSKVDKIKISINKEVEDELVLNQNLIYNIKTKKKLLQNCQIYNQSKLFITAKCENQETKIKLVDTLEISYQRLPKEDNTVEKENTYSFHVFFDYFIPGYYRIRNGNYLTASLYIGSIVGLAAFANNERITGIESQKKQETQNNMMVYAYYYQKELTPMMMMQFDPQYNQFYNHKSTNHIALGAVGLIVILSALDVYFNKSEIDESKLSFSVGFGKLIEEGLTKNNQSFLVKYSFHF